jgi:hypothetical protein
VFCRRVSEQHHVLADHIEGDDDRLADDGGAAATDEGLGLVVARDVVPFLQSRVQ